MKQLLVLSGKGGTGKTTVAASFMAMAEHESHNRACADCDVDAPNMHFVLGQLPVVQEEPFWGLDVAFIDSHACTACGICAEHCRFGAIVQNEATSAYGVNTPACEGCGVCEVLCPEKAITMVKDKAGDMTLHKNDNSVFSTALLTMGKGNSGLLVTQVKKRMLNQALPNTPLAIIDGSPGIGCPVIASLNGVDMVLLVVEPTLSGISDMERIVMTAKGFGVPLAVCINRYIADDANTQRIENICEEEGLFYVGTIPYDPQVVRAINSGRTIMEFDCPASLSLREVFAKTMKIIEKQEMKLC